jgi:hypothetical protein
MVEKSDSRVLDNLDQAVATLLEDKSNSPWGRMADERSAIRHSSWRAD